MKRELQDIDCVLPESAFASSAEGKDSLDHINKLTAYIDNLILKRKRIDLALNAEPQVIQKILRMYLRHEYYAASGSDKAHFLMFVEGALLDSTESLAVSNLGKYFDRISVQTEKKYNQSLQTFEWKEEDFPLGIHAECFRVKIYSDKPCLCKVALQRATDGCVRYNISDQLRRVIPYVRIDPTEEEILLAVWQYVETNYLFVQEKDKRFVRLDEVSYVTFCVVTYQSKTIHTMYSPFSLHHHFH